ncbi:hypothetical protein [Halosimplex halobium]|uniref:hypothetical protein n=1 Tax=Halosimplex halobium TaxID=3396618 RepID=UPI003F56174C
MSERPQFPIGALKELEWPTIKIGECPVTGDEAFVIVHDDEPDECYHCGAEVSAS